MTPDKRSANDDIKDSAKDKKHMQPESATIDMPEVKDIPGQENIKVPQFREMQDTTISSSDEEGDGLLDDLNTDAPNPTADQDANVFGMEKKLLAKSVAHQPSPQRADFNEMALDDTDDDGTPLNEKGIRQDRSGEDLDVPGSGLDDEDEDIGEEDEENNAYSLPD
jgi:hypothetical protein